MEQVPGGREPTPLPSLRDMVSILVGLGPAPRWWPTNLRPDSPAEGSFVLALCQPMAGSSHLVWKTRLVAWQWVRVSDVRVAGREGDHRLQSSW